MFHNYRRAGHLSMSRILSNCVFKCCRRSHVLSPARLVLFIRRWVCSICKDLSVEIIFSNVKLFTCQRRRKRRKRRKTRKRRRSKTRKRKRRKRRSRMYHADWLQPSDIVTGHRRCGNQRMIGNVDVYNREGILSSKGEKQEKNCSLL